MDLQIRIIAISFIASVLISLAILPILKKFKVGQIEREYGPRSHLIKQGTPTMGGIIIAIVLICIAIVFSKINSKMIPIAIVIIGFGAVGFIDDFKKLILRDTQGLKPAYKIMRLTFDICSICFIFNKSRYWNRHNYTIF